MLGYLELKQKRHDLMAEWAGIDKVAETEARHRTDDEKARIAQIDAEIVTIDAELLLHEKRRERERTAPAFPEERSGLTNLQPALSGVHDRFLDKPWGYDTFQATAEEFAARYANPYVAASHPRHPAQRYQDAADGEFLRAVFRAAKGYGNDPRLTYQAAAQGAGEVVGADGGWLLPRPSTDRLMMIMTAGEVLSRVDRSVLTQSNSLDINVIDGMSRATGSRHGAVQGYRLDEGTAVTASRPKFQRLEFKLKKYAALGYATDELLADASLIGRIIFQAFGDELRFMAEDDIVNGTGAGTPQGILKTAALVSVAKETGQAATTFVYENVVKMVARFYAPLFPRSVWFINQDAFPQLYTMSLAVGTGGVAVYMPANGAAGSPFGTLFGRPVVPIEYAATLGTVGDVILADLGQYWFFDKGAPEEASSMHVAFTTDEQAFRVTYRCDGRLSWVGALTPYKGTGNTQSCVVALATRS